jgi:hypothetical protein
LDEGNGLSMPGRTRLERIEMQADRLMELVGALGNKVDRIADRQQELIQSRKDHDQVHAKWEADHAKHVEEHERRHRGLDFRWYGVVAGMVAAAVYVITQGGPPAVNGI